MQHKTAPLYTAHLMRYAVFGTPPKMITNKLRMQSRQKSFILNTMLVLMASCDTLPDALCKVMYLVVIRAVIVKAKLSSELYRLFRFAIWYSNDALYTTGEEKFYSCRVHSQVEAPSSVPPPDQIA